MLRELQAPASGRAIAVCVTLLQLVACGAPESPGAGLSSDQLARTGMLIEMSERIEASVGWGEPAEAICFAAGMSRDDGFDARAGTPGDPASIARLQEVDPRFTPASSCTVTEYWHVFSETGAPAHMLWIDSISASEDRRIWGTAVVGPGLGQTRGYVCTIREPRPQTVELTECGVAWFN